MTTDEKLDKIIALLKPLTESKIRIPTKEEIDKLKDHITDTSKKVKPTRYYPNGAYMDEPVFRSEYYFINPSGVYSDDWSSTPTDYEYLRYANCFPTEEAAEKELNRQQLTAKMYRDMRDERINGDWDINFEDRLKLTEEKFYPYLENLEENRIDYIETYTVDFPHNFYYKNETFIEDLKALGWTEEELKIVWFRV